jgi:membrane protease YdiL (CAAX protease family)
MTAAVLLVVVVLVLTNLGNHYWWKRWYLLACPLVAVLLVGVGKLAGLTWTEMGMGKRALVHGIVWGIGCVLVIAAVYGVALLLPGLSAVTGDPPHYRQVLFAALVEVPFATVLLEETAFRGVLLGLLEHDHGAVAATVVSSLLFGLWHIAPSLEDEGVRPPAWLAGHRLAVPAWIVGTVLFTAAAGVVFCLLRFLSGSVFAAMGLHWGTNGLGALLSLLAARRSVRRASRSQG